VTLDWLGGVEEEDVGFLFVDEHTGGFREVMEDFHDCQGFFQSWRGH